ncbi:MAG: hypothetical protein JWO02_2045 [Solirubrobacterales bacterium]|nr:hypothetical protein [Solirubrobacterales bacterium]
MSLGLAACGAQDGTTDTSGTRLPGGGPRPLEASYVFRDGQLTPGRVSIPATDQVQLVVSAADGRPHGIVVQVGGRRTRIVLRPSETVRRRLTGLRSPARYRLVPDGASDPVVLQVG